MKSAFYQKEKFENFFSSDTLERLFVGYSEYLE